MRIALLHFDLSGGPEEKNLALLEQGIIRAAQAGAKWVITPETAVQGYFFTQKDRPFQIPVQPAPGVQPIRELATTYGLTIFLGCAEQDAATGRYYNSCLVIGNEGEILGRHRKLRSHGTGAEGWATKGTNLEPIVCKEMSAGVLVCADSYFDEYAEVMKEKQAQIIVVPAAWPPGGCGGPPENAWKRCSKVSGLPVVVCNQTGNQERMDMSQAQSAVLVHGEVQFKLIPLSVIQHLFNDAMIISCFSCSLIST